MGNRCGHKEAADPDSAWKAQNKEIETNPVYKYVSLAGGGKLVEAYKNGGEAAVEKLAKTEIAPFLYNDGNGAIIRKIDYVNWKLHCQAKYTGSSVYDSRPDEEKLNDFKGDPYFKDFEEHEACWDLEKRGGVGETAFHLLYLADSAECYAIGEILLRLYPKLALDLYEGDEYFGEGSLHLAIVFGNLEAVKLLIAKGANVNQRATGRFFLPEDQKPTRGKTTNYEGYAYYGEYPLAFAACAGYQEIYDYLIENNANPNLQDSFGNTVLHMVVISDQVEMYKYIVRHHKRPAKTDIKNNANLTPLTLASKLGRHKIFKEMLELGSLELWRFTNITCSLYPLLALDSIGPKGETNWNSALMIIINGETDEHLDMLEGGVMRQLLDEKWKTFARKRFFLRLIMTFIHLSLICGAVYTRPGPGTNLLAANAPRDVIRFVCEILVCIACLLILLLDCFVEIGSQGIISFIKNCKHAPAQTVFMVSCFMILLCIPFRFLQLRITEDILLIIAVPGSWFFLLFFARSVKLTGPFVTMIYKMILGDLLRFGIIYIIFLIGFTQGFYFLFKGSTASDDQGFSDIGNTVMTLFQMTLGEFKYQSFNYTKYSWLTKAVFAVFMILVPILLLNMLIAMMGNTYQQVIAKSEKEWRKQWAKIVVVLERGFSKNQLLQFQKEYAIKMVGKPKDNLAEITDDQVEEQRALMVIKTSNKTKAKQRKGAVTNWKVLGKEVIKQIKKQRSGGRSGPILLQKIRRRRSSFMFGSGNESSDEDSSRAKAFSNTLAQLAWERDIDLTKGQRFISDPGLIENSSPSRSPHHASQIPNGKPRTAERTVKKPAGAPKSSPKTATKQFSYNRVSPLTKQASPTEESESDLEGSKPILEDVQEESIDPRKGMSIGEISLHGGIEQSRQNQASAGPVAPKTDTWEVPKIAYKPPKSEDGYTSPGSGDSTKGLKGPGSHTSTESSKSSKSKSSEQKSSHKKKNKGKKSKSSSRTSSTASLLHLSEAESKESEL